MEFIDLFVKMYKRELKDNTLIKLIHTDRNTFEYWKYINGNLYFTNKENGYYIKEPMDIFGCLEDRNILVEILEEEPEKIEKYKDNIKYYDVNTLEEMKQRTCKYIYDLSSKTNEIIDKVNELQKERFVVDAKNKR